MSSYFYNSNLSFATNTILFWTWESVIHHLYFIALFLQRQMSDKWKTGEIWKLNMEKECEFFVMLFQSDAKFCAEAIISLFAGLWFRNPKPTEPQKQWMGRLVANYQHTEAIIHFAIVLTGLVVIYQLGSVKKKNNSLTAGVGWFWRWGLFWSLAIEFWSMCIPYFFVFAWAWMPFIGDGLKVDPIVKHLEALSSGDLFFVGTQFGAALITMFWVATIVTFLDGWAMIKAWEFAVNGQSYPFTAALAYGVCGALTAALMIDLLFTEGARGAGETPLMGYAEFLMDTLHSMYGGGNIGMASLLKK